MLQERQKPRSALVGSPWLFSQSVGVGARSRIRFLWPGRGRWARHAQPASRGGILFGRVVANFLATLFPVFSIIIVCDIGKYLTKLTGDYI